MLFSVQKLGVCALATSPQLEFCLFQTSAQMKENTMAKWNRESRYMVVSAKMGKKNFHSVFHPSENKASNFINFHFENGLFRIVCGWVRLLHHRGWSNIYWTRMEKTNIWGNHLSFRSFIDYPQKDVKHIKVEKRPQNWSWNEKWKRTFIYSFCFSFYLFFPTIFHTGKITRSKTLGIPRHGKTYYVKRSCKGAFYGQCFIIYFFIQLVSHHTQIRLQQSDMEWLQFHLIATQTAQNHIIFVCYSISKEKKITILL